jgi:hypothetical protein
MGRPVPNTNMGCTRTISTACSSGYHSLENYLSSKPRRPRYLEQPPYVTMVRTYSPTMLERASTYFRSAVCQYVIPYYSSGKRSPKSGDPAAESPP